MLDRSHYCGWFGEMEGIMDSAIAGSAEATSVRVTEAGLMADLADGRTVSVPLPWYPRLAHATPEERGRWRLIGRGEGVHWPDVDEDISIAGLLAGRPSGESQRSLQRWLDARNAKGVASPAPPQ